MVARDRWWLAIVVWLGATCAGFGVLWRYAATRGADTSAPAVWPEATHLQRAQDKATLVMFVHPRCACSRASLTELGRLLPRVQGRVAAQVVFVQPDGVEAGWAPTSLRALAAQLPDVTVVDDEKGVEARRFGAATSGACLLYNAAGELAFSGGITAVRGHEGDSAGQQRLIALLNAGQADRADSPVFGCALQDSTATEKGGP